jgi:hypothetical protein
MNDLDRALDDIKAMRSQLARGVEFHGYGPLTVALTAAVAVAAASIQSQFIPDPAREFIAWLGLWTAVAAISTALVGAEVIFRARRVHGGLADAMIQEAALQLLPAAGAGAMLTLVLWRYAPQSLWMLPGLWQITLSLGVFAACRGLPPLMVLAAFWYLLTGLVCLALAHSLSPWAMGVPFGLGELLAAGLLAVSARD